MLNPVANWVFSIHRGWKLAADREREGGGPDQRAREVIMPVRSYDQRSARMIRVTRARPIRARLGFCENL